MSEQKQCKQKHHPQFLEDYTWRIDISLNSCLKLENWAGVMRGKMHLP